MYDPAIDLLIRAIGNKEPYEKLMTLVNTALLPYVNEITRDKRLKDLFDAIYRCKKCGLCPTSGAKAIPKGNTYAEIMIVGEGASEDDCTNQDCFTGPSGDLLMKMLDAASKKIDVRFNKNSLYFTNVVKGRPIGDDNKNRKPTMEEQIACNSFLLEEIELVKPRAIICLGSTAAKLLISPDFVMKTDRNKFYGDEPKKITMYHPSYLLHLTENSPEQNAAKKDCWQVLQTVNTYLDNISSVPRA